MNNLLGWATLCFSFVSVFIVPAACALIRELRKLGDGQLIITEHLKAQDVQIKDVKQGLAKHERDDARQFAAIETAVRDFKEHLPLRRVKEAILDD